MQKPKLSLKESLTIFMRVLSTHKGYLSFPYSYLHFHLLTTLAKLLRPSGGRTVIAEKSIFQYPEKPSSWFQQRFLVRF
jgi:hypothetical protein